MIYVDNARIPATVNGIKGRWSHLTADTKEELLAFAILIGLKSEWWQTCKGRCGPLGQECIHWHFDVTDTLRRSALDAGAKSITVREVGALLAARRVAQKAQAAK